MPSAATMPTFARPRAAILVVATMATLLTVGSVPALAQGDDLDARGGALVEQFIDILKLPDADKKAGLTDFLAEEFQLVRSNGVRIDRAGYIADPATVFEVELTDIHTTEADGVVVVSYTLSVDEVLDGVETKTVAPRLSVFHQTDDGDWQIAAHANFGALER